MIRFLQRRWKLFCFFTVAFVALLLVSSWAFGTFYSSACNHPVPLPKNFSAERVAFQSRSSATIHGWLIGSETNHAVVILQHGIHGDKSALVERAKFLSRSSYAVLLFDFQAHGESIGKQITFGYLESRDSQAAVEFVKKRFPDKPIAIVGTSLGAAAAVLADPPLDVQAMVLESMYPTLVEATKDRLEIRLGRMGRCFSPLLTAQIKIRAGCHLDDLRPIVGVERIKAPKLFLAGTADRETKISEAKQIFASAAEPKLFIPIEGAKHEDLLGFNPQTYEKIVLDFLNTHLK